MTEILYKFDPLMDQVAVQDEETKVIRGLTLDEFKQEFGDMSWGSLSKSLGARLRRPQDKRERGMEMDVERLGGLERKLQGLAVRECWCDDEAESINKYAEGDIDNAYSGGVDDGEALLARELLEKFFKEDGGQVETRKSP